MNIQSHRMQWVMVHDGVGESAVLFDIHLIDIVSNI